MPEPHPNHRSRNRRGEGGQLRTDLVEAASHLLETLTGQEALSLRAVARQAGVAPQSVYLHFTDRHDVLSAVYEARFGELFDALSKARAEVTGSAARLTALCRAYCAYGQRNPGHYRVLFGTAGTPGWEPPGRPEPAGLPAYRMLLDAVTDCGVPDPTPTTACLWAGLHGLVTLRQDRPSFPWPDLDVLIDTLVAAHTAAPRPRP